VNAPGTPILPVKRDHSVPSLARVIRARVSPSGATSSNNPLGSVSSVLPSPCSSVPSVVAPAVPIPVVPPFPGTVGDHTLPILPCVPSSTASPATTIATQPYEDEQLAGDADSDATVPYPENIGGTDPGDSDATQPYESINDDDLYCEQHDVLTNMWWESISCWCEFIQNVKPMFH